MAPTEVILQPSSPSSSPVMKYMEVIGAPADPRDEEVLSIISSVSTLVLRSQNNSKLVQALKELETSCHYLLHISPHYDVSSETPGNGVRSFVKLVRGFLKQLEQKSSHPEYFSSARKRCRCMKSVALVNTLIQLLFLIEEKRASVNSSDGMASAEIVNQSNWSIDEKITTTFLSLDHESTSAFLSMKPFWLSHSVWFFDELYARLIALRVRPSYKFLSVLSPRKVVQGNADFTLNGDVNDLRKTWSFYGWKIMRPYVTMSTSFKPKIRKVIRVPRQEMFLIEGSAIKMRGSAEQRTGAGESARSLCKVSCLFLHDNKLGHSPSDSLVIHLHGGGFCTIRPKAHEIYLRRWASRLRGVPILSIDYSLSPESRYPVALQEILDVYLFLCGIDSSVVVGHKEAGMRKDEEIVSLIGFKPKSIVLCGDSAGSNLSVALMHVLRSLNELLLNNNSNNNDPRRSGDCLKIPYPRSVCLQYPYMTPTVTRFTPSRLLMAFDPILPLGAMFSLSEAYHPMQSSKSHQDDDQPWYRKPDYRQRLRQIQDTDLGAFFNPLCGKFDDFRDIPLFIQVGEFDPLLDDAVSLTKKWKGPVKLDIVDGLTHGYLFNAVLSSACHKAVDLSNDRLIQALFGR